jgi:hypothetical protein
MHWQARKAHAEPESRHRSSWAPLNPASFVGRREEAAGQDSDLMLDWLADRCTIDSMSLGRPPVEPLALDEQFLNQYQYAYGGVLLFPSSHIGLDKPFLAPLAWIPDPPQGDHRNYYCLSADSSPFAETSDALTHYAPLASLDFSVMENRSGRNLVRLGRARSELYAFEAAVTSALGSGPVPILFCGDPRQACLNLSTDEALPYFESFGPESRLIYGHEVLHYILHDEELREALTSLSETVRELLERITQKFGSLRRILITSIARFCGLAWARRNWFLLHGSHPPRTERRQFDSESFGCAESFA